MTVYIYQDYVHNNAVLLKSLQTYFGHEKVYYIDAHEILDQTLKANDILFMPGGADLYYCEKLSGKANSLIREFVESGGVYFGICAGAYYGCSKIEWAKNDNEPIIGARELSFYKGTAIGPIYSFLEDEDINKSWDYAANIEYDNEIFPVLYSGGPLFNGHDDNSKILARYIDLPDEPAAIIECKVGKGLAILCSPHIEYDSYAYMNAHYNHKNSSIKHTNDALTNLQGNDTQIKNIWTSLLKRAEYPNHV